MLVARRRLVFALYQLQIYLVRSLELLFSQWLCARKRLKEDYLLDSKLEQRRRYLPARWDLVTWAKAQVVRSIGVTKFTIGVNEKTRPKYYYLLNGKLEQ